MVQFAIKYLKMYKCYGKSDYIFGKFALLSIGITFNIMGFNPTTMPENLVENYWYFNFCKYSLSYMSELKSISH